MNGRAVGRNGKGALHLNSKVGGFLRAIGQAECCQHIAFGRDAHARAATLSRLVHNLFPQVALRLLDFIALGVTLNLLLNLGDLFHLEVDDVVHNALCFRHVVAEEVEVEGGLGSKRILHIAIEVDGQEATTIVGTEGNLATGVR